MALQEDLPQQYAGIGTLVFRGVLSYPFLLRRQLNSPAQMNWIRALDNKFSAQKA
jgi:hypothetical protein